MPGCLWSSVKREVGLYHLQLHGFFFACDKRILTVLIPQEHKTPN